MLLKISVGGLPSYIHNRSGEPKIRIFDSAVVVILEIRFSGFAFLICGFTVLVSSGVFFYYLFKHSLFFKHLLDTFLSPEWVLMFA